jgi:biopolymer transport protein ExbD
MAVLAFEDDDGAFARINVTPLVDVLLVLLIIFMLTSPLLSHKVALDFSRCDVRCPASAEPVTLSIKDTGELYWNGAAINRAELAQNLAVLGKQANPAPLLVHAQARTRYEWIAQALVAAKNAGVERISVAPASR